MRLVALATLVVLALPVPGHGAKPKPPLCEAGSFAVAEASSPLVPGGTAVPDALVLGEDGTLALASGCPAVAAKQKGARKGNKLSAKWTKKKGLCTGLPKTASLKATFDPACTSLSGIFKSKGVKRAFTATRSFESFGAPSLAPALDAARHTTKTLGPAGGDVFARGAGGTRFRLAVPPGALADEVTITLTPVTALAGLPFDGTLAPGVASRAPRGGGGPPPASGLLAAVDLAPAGLAFSIPATLYVMPAGGIPDGLLAGFGWSGAESRFAVSPWSTDPAGRWLAMSVEHFSGYGIGIPGPSQLDALAGALMGLAASQGTADSIVATCLQGPAPCSAAELAAIFVQWYDVVVGPRLSAASDVVARITAHEALLHWMAAVAAATPLLETSPGSGLLPSSLDSRRGQGLALDFANLHSSMLVYARPGCSGAVTDWRDWLRIPEELRTRAAQLHGGNAEFATVFGLSPARYCVGLFVTVIEFPATVEVDTTALPLSLRSWIRIGDPTGPVSSLEFVPVAAALELAYSEGASGPAEVETGADGHLAEPVPVERMPGAPLFVRVEIAGTELALDRPDVLSDDDVARAGALAFEGNLDDAPPPILEPDSTSEHCVQVSVGPPTGQIVAFALEGPGSLSAESDATEIDASGGGTGRACVEYTAPEGPVARDEPTRLRASLVFGGQTYEDELTLHPRWVEIALQADVGAGLEEATNEILWVPDTGPFAIAATVTGPGATAEDPPQPADGAALDADAQDALLSLGGADGSETLGLVTNAAGLAGFALSGDEAETTHAVELRHDPQGSSDAAGVVLKRLPTAIALLLPAAVTPGAPVPFEVVASEGSDPAAGYYVELTVTGGSVGADSGTTNAEGEFQTSATLEPGQTLLTIVATLRAEPDGEALAVQTAQAGTNLGYATLLSRIESFTLSTDDDSCCELPGNDVGPRSFPFTLVTPSTRGDASGEYFSDVVQGAGGSLAKIEARTSVTAYPPDEGEDFGGGVAYLDIQFQVVDHPVEVDLELVATASGAPGTVGRVDLLGGAGFFVQVGKTAPGSQVNGCIDQGSPCPPALEESFTLGPGSYYLRAAVGASPPSGGATSSASFELELSFTAAGAP